jgi:hypothetical protein
MEYHGATEVPLRQRHVIAEDGIGTYTVTMFYETEPTLPAIGSAPAEIITTDRLAGVTLYDLTSLELGKADGGFELSLTYKGIGQDVVLVSVDGGTSDESITSHPDFAAWAGTPAAPIFSRSFWDKLEQGEDGDPSVKSTIYKFAGFKEGATVTGGGGTFSMSGVESYLVGSYTIQITDLLTNGHSFPDAATIGIPSVAGWTFPGTYLFESPSVEKHGSAYRRTRRYRKAGAVPWNGAIYAAS